MRSYRTRGRGRAMRAYPTYPTTSRFSIDLPDLSLTVDTEHKPGSDEFDEALTDALFSASLPTAPEGFIYEANVIYPTDLLPDSAYAPSAPEMPQPDRQKLTDRITPEILSTLGPPPTAHASSTRQWQAGKHTIIQQIDVETKTEQLPCSEARGCYHEGLEGRLSSSSRQCARDLSGTDRESSRSCGDGEHSECSDSHTSQSEDCRHHDNSPCDCCRHGHSLTSFIRSPEDCRTCFRHMGGSFVSPKYPQIRQRMLKTLNQRRDHSEDDPDAPKAKAAPPVSVNSIPCGKKERLIILNPENFNEDVDDVVRMIEGTKSCNDPRKAAKKARQKERKIQSKVEEDFRREEEERKIKEEEERIRRVKEEKEEEERRKAEDLKRQARKVKKKNRKKKDADNLRSPQSVLLKADIDERQTDNSLHFSVTGSSGPSETVRKVLETANPLNDAGGNTDKPRMVTIRRHPATHDNQNVVTITLSDDKEGKSPVYMLLNGHLVSSNAFSGSEQIQGGSPTLKNEVETLSSTSDKKKKKNKKKQPQPQLKSQCNSHGESFYSLPERDIGSVPSHGDHIPDLPTSMSSFQPDNHSVNFENLSLPPGITITKVQSPEKSESFTVSPGSKVSQYRVPVDQELFYMDDDDDDFLGRKETQEFEEVINKTRRKKMKAARTSNDRDGSEETEARESPNNIKHLTRRPFICDSKAVPVPEKPIESPKVVNNGKGMIKTSPSFKKVNGSYTNDHPNGSSKPRREHATFRHDGFPSVNHTQVPVMPRLHRAHLKNREGTGVSHCHVPTTNYDGRQPYSSFDSQNCQNNQSLNGVTVSERNYTNAPLTSPQHQQQFLGSRGNGATSAPPHTSWNQGAAPTQFSHPPSLSVQSEQEKEGSWTPWMDWSEQSTPEHPSPRLGVGDQFYRDTQPPKTFAFHELNQKSKSPIQRPIHNPLEGNSTQLNGHFPRDLPPAPSQPYASFQSNFDENNEREAVFRYHQMQQRQALTSSLYPTNLSSFNGQRISGHPTEQEKGSWSAFSGVQPPAYLQRRPSDTGDFILTQPTPTRGKSGDISWEPYSGKKSPLQETAERLHQLGLSPLTELSDLPPILATAITPGYRIGGYDAHAAHMGSGFVGAPPPSWQIGPSTARDISAKPFQPSADSYNWDPTFHSRFTGGGAV